MGKGYENEKYYRNIKLTFHNIKNLYGVANSFSELMTVKTDYKNSKGFYKALGNSEWYEFISDILEFSQEIAEKIVLNKWNVLIHCSDGWDRTS